MSVYYCESCDQYIDGDYNPCCEHPKSKSCICEDCYIEYEDINE